MPDRQRAQHRRPVRSRATCRAIGVPAQAYLTWAFERLGTHRDFFGLTAEQMTPAAFKATLA